MSNLRRSAAIAGCILVAACSDWLGGSGDPPLPGERISVLVHQRALSPDPGADPGDILLPPPAINREWPQAGGYANHAMHHLAVGDSLALAWRVRVGTASDDEERFVASPVVAGGRLFAMDPEHQVTALDAVTGDRLWRVELAPEDEEDDGHISGGLAVDDGRLYASTGFADLVALDAATGGELWRRRLSGPMRAAPAVRGGRVFAVTLDNRLHALNGFSGEPLWEHAGIAEAASLLGGASPAVDAGAVVAPYSSGELVALRVGNGRVLWNDSLATRRRIDELAALSHIRGRPLIDRDLVIATSHAGVTAAIDLRSGRRTWDRDIGGPESPWVAGDFVYLLTNDAELVCLSRQSGAVFWVSALPAYEDEDDREDPIQWTGPILVSDRLIVAGSHGLALAVSPYTGAILGQVEISDDVTVPPVVADGTVYFLADDAEVSAYR